MDRPSRGAGGGGGWALRALKSAGPEAKGPGPRAFCLAGPGALGPPDRQTPPPPPAPLRQDRPVGVPGGFLLQWSYPRR